MAIDFNPMSDINCEDPFSLFRRLRDEAPVHWSAEDEMFCVSRYSDVMHVLKEDELFSSSGTLTVLLRSVEVPINLKYGLKLLRFLLRTRISPFRIAKAGNLITMDRPRHDVLRKIVGRGIPPRRIANWEPRIRDIVDEQLVDLRNGERFDVVRDLANPADHDQYLFRAATRDTEIAGVKIPKDSVVAAMVSSANRDERYFEDPDRFDLDRDTSGHLGFGVGIHFCLGAALARLESRVALGALLPRLQGFVRVEKRPERLASFLVRGRARLELEAV